MPEAAAPDIFIILHTRNQAAHRVRTDAIIAYHSAVNPPSDRSGPSIVRTSDGDAYTYMESPQEIDELLCRARIQRRDELNGLVRDASMILRAPERKWDGTIPGA